MKRLVYICVLISLVMLTSLWGRDSIRENNYHRAMSFEKSGEYSKAESLYVELYTSHPDNFIYFTRYKNMLIQQQKFETLLPVIEKRVKERAYDRYLKLELAVLYFTLGESSNAEEIFRSVFKDISSSMQNSYATSIYQNVIEYGQGNNCFKIIDQLRGITGNPELLVRYSFITSLRYRNWEEAVKEILVILETNPANLRYVRSELFRYDPSSDLYQRIIKGISGQNSPEGKELLSEIYIYLNDLQSAFEILSRDNSDISMQKAMLKFANRMYKRGEFNISLKAATWTQKSTKDDNLKITMALLAARSKEQLFYRSIQEPALIFVPYASDFTNIKFRSFNTEQALLIESAYSDYDSLSMFPGVPGDMARMRKAEISYMIYQDFDKGLNEFLALANNMNTEIRKNVISKISELYLAKGEYKKAVSFLKNAGNKYHLMVHEEDQLLPQSLFVSIIAGNMDSLTQRTMDVLAMLPKDDPLYNDVLSFSGFINIVAKDTLYRDDWLEGERYLLQNNLAQAGQVFKALLDKKSPAMTIYALRYLDCLNILHDTESESIFWENYSQNLLETDMADYFMIRHAEFYEKVQKYEIAIELFEKYLLSYPESMYYETIREYIRQQYSTGAP
ncbi:MAG: tetratricopeptide repeat protein [Candidatus Marinimicrobia bacterium]|nr:tetratricopeptide repeat protein [Candidatus Neomarinimicrobiota bacterium]